MEKGYDMLASNFKRLPDAVVRGLGADPPRIDIRLAVLLLAVLVGFLWLQPVGYLGSGLIGAFGAKAIRPVDRRTGPFWLSTEIASALGYGVIAASVMTILVGYWNTLP
jgi:hypothetical protein